MIDSIIRVNKMSYPQTLLEEWKYEIKKSKKKNFIIDDSNSSLSDNESDNDSDNDSDNELDNESDNEYND